VSGAPPTLRSKAVSGRIWPETSRQLKRATPCGKTTRRRSLTSPKSWLYTVNAVASRCAGSDATSGGAANATDATASPTAAQVQRPNAQRGVAGNNGTDDKGDGMVWTP